MPINPKILTNIFNIKLVYTILFASFIISMPISALAYTYGNKTTEVIIGQKDAGPKIELSICLKNTGAPYNLRDSAFGFDTINMTTDSSQIEKGIFGEPTPRYIQNWFSFAGVPNISESWGMEAYNADYNGTVPVNTTLQFYGKATLTKTGTNPKINLTPNDQGIVEPDGSSVNLIFTLVNTDCRNSTPITPPKLNLKVFLEGAYNTNTSSMNTSLQVKGLIPNSQPFGIMGYSGTESFSTIPVDSVD